MPGPRLTRRSLMQAAAATLAMPAIARAEAATTLKFIPYADLALLDPLVSAFITRNHAMTIFDTLFALDEAGVAQPQMLEGYTVEADGLLWRLTLRDGLKFHDNSPVLARDAVASIRRWAVKDSFGQALIAATDELSAPSDKMIQFRLKRPFPLLPDALAKPTNLMAAIMPERLATTPATTILKEMVGSGPYSYVAAERVPGARNVYRRFDGYVPRPQGTASFTAGPRIAYFDRVEWLTTPDPGTQVAALQAGEVDWVEQPLMDLVPKLRADPKLKTQILETKGLIGMLRFNQLFAPFDNKKIRQAVLHAVNQHEFMYAVVGENAPLDDHVGVFGPKSDMANDAGMEVLNGRQDIARLRQDILDAGYKGEKVVFLTATDVPRINAICEVGAEMLRKLGMNVDEVSTDWGTVVQRSVSRQPLDKGGWSIFGAMVGGYDWLSPATNQQIRGNGLSAYNGWPTSERQEALRDAWLAAPDLAAQRALAREIQVQALDDAPVLPLGAYYQPTAYRSDLTGMLNGLPLFTNIRRV